MKIRRPLLISAFSILVVIYAANTMPKSSVMFSLALFALFIFIHKLTVNRYTAALVFALVSMISGLSYLSAYNQVINNLTSELQSMETIIITGDVVNTGVTGASQYIDVKIDKANNEKIHPIKVRIYSNEYLSRGDMVSISGKFKSFTAKSNYIYNFSQGVFGYFNAEDIKREDGVTINKLFYNILQKLKDKSYRIFDYRYSDVAVAMGLGDRDALPDKIADSFNYAGISHVLVVSGLHVGIIAGAFSKLLQKLPFKKKYKNGIVAVFVFIFMGMIGFTPSVIRAGCLMLSVLYGHTFIEETDNYTTLAIIILITLFLNPYSANNGSLLLSYSAYFGVVQAVQLCMEKEYNYIVTALIITTFACVYTAPVLALLGMGTTLLSPVYNLIASPVVAVICVLSFFLPVLSFVPAVGNIACIALAPVNELCIAFLVWFAQCVKENLSFAFISLAGEKVVFVIIAAAIATAIAFIQFRDKRKRKIFIIVIPIVVLLCYNIMNKDIAVVRVFDGSSEPSYIVSYQDKDYLVMTENINHNRFRSLINECGIERFDEIYYCPEKDFDTEFISDFADKVILVESSGTYSNDVLHITAKLEKRSMVYYMDIGGVTFGFNHKKADLSEKSVDFYFYGSDTPKDYIAENSYYFYPVIKANKEMAEETGAIALYDILTIKINIENGNYRIVKDVKNFGNQL